MRRFRFNRKVDSTGVSGTGSVAEGVVFGNGLVALSWNSLHKCVNVYTSFAEMEAVHSHGGNTEIVWIDEDESASEESTDEKPKKRKPKEK